MKKYCKWLGVVMFAAVMFLTAGTTGKAVTAENMQVTQTSALGSSVSISWSAPIKYKHFHVVLTDGLSTIDYKNTPLKTMTITGLNQGAAYGVCVYAFTDAHSSNCTLANAAAKSEEAIVSTQIGNITDLVQTGATTNTVTLAWNAVAGASGYKIFVSSGGQMQQCAVSTTNSVTLTGLYPSSKNIYKVEPIRITSGNYQVEGTGASIYAKTVPAPVTNAQPTSVLSNINVLYLGWSEVQNADGYQLQVQTMKGKNLLLEDQGISTSKRISPFWKGKVFKIRARAYIQIGMQKVYGAWSPYSYAAESSKIVAVRAADRRSSKRRKITLKWKKVSGVSKYLIYISTKSDSGWKKVKALGSKKTKYTIRKCGKKKLSKTKKYYVQLRYQIKVGKKKMTTKIVDKAICY